MKFQSRQARSLFLYSFRVIATFFVVTVVLCAWGGIECGVVGKAVVVSGPPINARNIGAEFGEPRRRIRNSVFVGDPAPEKQMLLPGRNVFEVRDSKHNRGELKYCSGPDNQWQRLAGGERIKIQRPIRPKIGQRGVVLAYSAFGRTTTAIAPCVQNLVSRDGFTVWRQRLSNAGAIKIDHSPLVRGVEPVGRVTHAPQEESEKAEYSREYSSPPSGGCIPVRLLLRHLVILFLLLVEIVSFISTVVLIGRCVKTKKASVALCTLFSATICGVTIYQLGILIMGR